MALYRLSTSNIGRGAGTSIVASAAYRAAERLAELGDRVKDALGAAAYRSGDVLSADGDRDDGAVVHDYSRKSGVVHSEILTPEHAPVWMDDRERLWNAVEASEKRHDARLAREIQLALPRELSREDQIGLVREFAREQLVSRGMVVDLALHETKARDGERQPHAHLLLTTRSLDSTKPLGFGNKERSWNSKELLRTWRQSWAEHVNHALEREQIVERVDHRTLEAQRQDALAQENWDKAASLDREPEPKLGYAAAALERQGIPTERGELWRGVQERNAERREVYDLVKGFGEHAQRTFLELRERAGDALTAFESWSREAYSHARDWLHERVESVAATARSVGRFAGLKLDAGPRDQPALAAERASPTESLLPLERDIAGYARAWADADRMRAAELPVLPHQTLALDKAGKALEGHATNLTRDVTTALEKMPSLAREAGSVEGARVLGAAAGTARQQRLVLDERARSTIRAWNELEQAYTKAEKSWDHRTQRAIAGRMERFGRDLKRDTALDRTLRERGHELGLAEGSRLERVVQAQDLRRELARELRLGRSQGLGMGR